MNSKYETLMSFFKDVKLNYEEENNSKPYIDSAFKALEYINNIKYCFYKNISTKVPTIVSKNNKELYRPISPRQSCCLTKCLQFTYSGKYASAMNELMDAIEDYENYKQKELISISECFLFSDVLEIMNEKMRQNQ